MAEATETPVLDLLASMTADSIEASGLDPESLMLVRIAALVAVDAPPASYLMNLGVASELGIDAEKCKASSRGSPRLWEPPASCQRAARSFRRSRSTSSSPPSTQRTRNRAEASLSGQAITHVDATGLDALLDAAKDVRRNGITLVIARMRTRMEEQLEAAGVLAVMGREHLYPSVRAAVDACPSQGGRS